MLPRACVLLGAAADYSAQLLTDAPNGNVDSFSVEEAKLTDVWFVENRRRDLYMTACGRRACEERPYGSGRRGGLPLPAGRACICRNGKLRPSRFRGC